MSGFGCLVHFNQYLCAKIAVRAEGDERVSHARPILLVLRINAWHATLENECTLDRVYQLRVVHGDALDVITYLAT